MSKSNLTVILFQSTLPARGATACQSQTWPHRPHFNPRSPRGERHELAQRIEQIRGKFQSTLPARGATTWISSQAAQTAKFQSTLPSRGATVVSAPLVPGGCHFNPRSPHGERPLSGKTKPSPRSFQSTLPVRGATGGSRF